MGKGENVLRQSTPFPTGGESARISMLIFKDMQMGTWKFLAKQDHKI
jgi:hypothetical protein